MKKLRTQKIARHWVSSSLPNYY